MIINNATVSLFDLMELPLISHRKSQRRNWNPLGGAPSLLPSPILHAVSSSLTSFPCYLQNSSLGATTAHHPQPPEWLPSASLPWEKPGYPWGHGFLGLPLSGRGWHSSRPFKVKAGRWHESSFLFPQYSFQIIPPPLFWENHTPLQHCHLYLFIPPSHPSHSFNTLLPAHWLHPSLQILISKFLCSLICLLLGV